MSIDIKVKQRIKAAFELDAESGFLSLMDLANKYGVYTQETSRLCTEYYNRKEYDDNVSITDISDLIITANNIIDKIGLDPSKVAMPEGNQVTDSIRQMYFEQLPKEKRVFYCRDICKKYNGFTLSGIDLDLRLGEITGIVGENGTGKTTLLRMIAGELERTDGIINYPLFSKDKLDWKKIKAAIGYIPQRIDPWLGNITVEHLLKLTAAVKGISGVENEKKVSYIIARLALHDYKNKRWEELSGGYKLRFELARQLVWSPKLLVLDEPLANLDIKSQRILLDDLESLAGSVTNPVSIVLSSQNLFEVEKVSDNILFVRNGRSIYNGPVSNIGANLSYRCFEIDAIADNDQILLATKHLDVKKIKSSTYTLLYTGENTSISNIALALSQNNIEIKYMREITKSTRLLFDYDGSI